MQAGFSWNGANTACSDTALYALIAQQAERIHGKDEVTSSILVEGSNKYLKMLDLRERESGILLFVKKQTNTRIIQPESKQILTQQKFF